MSTFSAVDYNLNIVSKCRFFFIFKHFQAPDRSWKFIHGGRGPGKSWIFVSKRVLLSPAMYLVHNVSILFTYYTGESCVEVKIEADSDDITECSHDDKPRPYLCMVCDKRFTQKANLKEHKQTHTGEQCCIHVLSVRNVLLISVY